jgi:hypothetical protein
VIPASISGPTTHPVIPAKAGIHASGNGGHGPRLSRGDGV